MSARITVVERVGLPRRAFADRSDAGQALGRLLAPAPRPDAIVLALPRGGVPVGAAVSRALGASLSPVAVRKLPIPSDPEMGFGAVTADGTVTLNHAVMRRFGITFGQSAVVIEHVKEELRRRAGVYPGAEELPDVEGRTVLIVDDGLATGYTMLATSEMVRHARPDQLVVAVPVAPASTLELVAEHCDELICLIAQEGELGFAVASFYQRFPDLSDEEVVAELASAGTSASPS